MQSFWCYILPIYFANNRKPSSFHACKRWPRVVTVSINPHNTADPTRDKVAVKLGDQITSCCNLSTAGSSKQAANHSIGNTTYELVATGELGISLRLRDLLVLLDICECCLHRHPLGRFPHFSPRAHPHFGHHAPTPSRWLPKDISSRRRFCLANKLFKANVYTR
jgi:hypothetical protein